MAKSVLAAYAAQAEWQSVQSSNVAAVAYQPDFRRLFVRFKDGSAYAYEDVTQATYEAFLSAPSKGRFVWDVLRGAHGVRPIDMAAIDAEYVYRKV